MVAERGEAPLQERISERIREQIVDAYVSQVLEQVTELPKTPSRDRTLQGTVEPVLDVLLPQMVEQLLEVPKIIPQDRILQRTVTQIVDRSEAKRADLAKAEKSLGALMASQAVSKSSYTQVASDHEASGRAFADELKALAEATQVLQSETSGAEGQTHSLFQESSSAALQTSTDLKGFEMVISVRRLAEQEHSTALDQLASRMSAIMKFGASADGDPFVKVKDLITDLISRLQAEASSETNQKSYCDEEMPKATEKKEDLEADVAKHSSKLEAAVARSIDLDGEISTLQSTNTDVQHVVNTAEVETPRIIKVAIRGRNSVIRERINQVTEHIRNPQIPYMKKVDDMPVAVQRQIPMVQTVQETTEISQLKCIDKVVDDPVVQVPQIRVMEKTVEAPQLQIIEQIVEIPETQTIQGARTSERSGITPVCQETKAEIREVIEIGASIPAESASTTFVTAPLLETPPVVVGSAQPAHVAKHMALAPTVSCADAAVTHATRPLPATTMAVAHRLVDEKLADDMVSEIRDLKSDLVHIRELLGVLVRKERCAETKAEIEARRFDRMERERDQESEAECEATLEEAPADHSKVARVIVGKTPSGQVVFIHASAVQGAEVLKIGTDARVEVVNDDARAQGRYRARRAWGQDAWKAEKDKERANKVAQQVRRAAALTAELAAQSEKKTAAVCDQPPGLGELAGHIEAPNMGAGGSHLQATVMPDPWATYKCPSARDNQAETTAETNRIPADRGVLAQTRMFRGARLRSATRAPSTRSRGPNLTKEESQQRNRTEQEQRLCRKKEEAWELYQRQPTLTRKTRENFETKFREKVLGGIYSNSKDEQERERLAVVDERAGRGTEAGGV